MRVENTDREFDIVVALLDLLAVLTPDLPPEKSREIEQTMRIRYGGLRTRIAKRKQHPTPAQREQIVREALSESHADVPTDQIAESNGISRRTLYRYLKRGGG